MATAPVIGVLALQGDVREHARALAVAGARAVPVRRRSELDAVAGLVIPGGESTAIMNLLGVFDLLTPLRARIAAGLPVYGSCAGMILLADRIVGGTAGQVGIGGLDVTVRRNAFGRQVDSFEIDLPMTGIDDAARPIRTVFIRAPWAEQTGAEVQVLAMIPEADAAGNPLPAAAVGKVVAVRQGNLLATAFHPEVTGDHRVHDLFVRMVMNTDQT